MCGLVALEESGSVPGAPRASSSSRHELVSSGSRFLFLITVATLWKTDWEEGD